MTRSALIAIFITSAIIVACGGAEQPPSHATIGASGAGQAGRDARGATEHGWPGNSRRRHRQTAWQTRPRTSRAPEPAALKASTPASAPGATPDKPGRNPERPAYTRTDLQVGTGREAQKGKGLTVNYTGWLYDPGRPDLKGRMFDTSQGRGPFNFVLGAGQVIPGWDQGFDGMKIGGRGGSSSRPTSHTDADGAGGGIIPPNATLIFEMELLDVQQ